MKPRRIEFSFKGDRDYIQGTDIFNALVGQYQCAKLRNIHFTIHGFVRTPMCEAYQADSREGLDQLRNIKARASFDFGGIRQWLALKDLPALGPARRCEYPEDRITSLCDVRGRTIVLERASPFPFIETVVAMNKHLHQKLFADATGKWVFTGAALTQGCDAREGFSLQIGSEVNYRLTRAEIVHNGRAIGSLLFSLARQ